MSTLPVALALWRLNLLRGDELPDIAVSALTSGLDSPSLRILAGLEKPTRDEAAPVLERAATELGLQIPEPRNALLVAAKSIAAEIVAGLLSPYDGARRIWSLWYNDYPDELMIFVASASQIEDFRAQRLSDPDRYERLIQECERDIRDAAHALLADVAA